MPGKLKWGSSVFFFFLTLVAQHVFQDLSTLHLSVPVVRVKAALLHQALGTVRFLRCQPLGQRWPGGGAGGRLRGFPFPPGGFQLLWPFPPYRGQTSSSQAQGACCFSSTRRHSLTAHPFRVWTRPPARVLQARRRLHLPTAPAALGPHFRSVPASSRSVRMIRLPAVATSLFTFQVT